MVNLETSAKFLKPVLYPRNAKVNLVTKTKFRIRRHPVEEVR